jgi:uncharacterized protein with ParB-like and HNH nuclease domain
MATNGVSLQIKLDGIGHAIADNKLMVPIYQRSYAWEKDNITNLYQDWSEAIRRGDQEYFLGSIVVAHSDQNTYHIIDGQQRLATTSIFLAAIRDYFHAKGELKRAAKVQNDYLLTTDIGTLDELPRLQLNSIDHDFFYKGILLSPDDPQRKNLHLNNPRKSHQRLQQASDLAMIAVEDETKNSPDPIGRLVEFITFIADRVKIIWLIVPDDTRGYVIFETLNDRAVELAASDLLKNFLFSKTSPQRLNEVQTNWNNMVEAIKADGDEEETVKYIRHLWSSMNGLTREKDLYKEIRKSVNSSQHAVELAITLYENAKLYSAIRNPSDSFWSSYNYTTREHIRTLNELRVEQYRPLLLSILRKFSQDKKTVEKSIELLVAWVVRFLVKGGGGGTLEEHYSSTASKIHQGKIITLRELTDEMKKVVPNDTEFKTAFINLVVTKNYLARYYLRTLELTARKQVQPENKPNTNPDEVNLEHILPQNPTSPGPWGHIKQEEADTYCYRLGNMVLLQADKNVKLGNKGFAEKHKVFAQSELLLTAEVAQTTQSSDTAWYSAEIIKRQERLAELAIETWGIS